MYDTKIALNTLLAIIYLSKKLESESVDEPLIQATLDAIKTPEQINEDDETSAISYIKGIAEETIYKKEFDRQGVLRRVKVATSLFPEYVQNLEVFLDESVTTPDDIRKTLNSHKNWLRQFINKNQLKSNVGRLYSALSRNDTSGVQKEIEQLKVTIDNDRKGTGEGTRIPGLVGSINSKDPKGFATAIRKSQEIISGAVFKTPFRGINRMLGAQGGVRMSELALMPALPFNGKTLFSQSMFLGMGCVNTAEDFSKFIPNDKEPMFMDMSFENTQDINIPQAFETMYGNLEGVSGEEKLNEWKKIKRGEMELIIKDKKGDKIWTGADDIAKGLGDVTTFAEWLAEQPDYVLKSSPEDMLDMWMKAEAIAHAADEAGKYMSSALSKQGWVYQFDQIINTDFSITYMQDMISMYESQGYHVMGVRADYLGTIKKEGLGNGIAGTDIKESYRIARNYTAMKDRFAFLPHQLSPDAKRFKAIDPTGFIKNLPGKGYYENCTSLDNEADLEFYFGVTDMEGNRYLEVQRGKHRAGSKTKATDLYCVIPFDPIRILPWDVLLDEELSKRSMSEFAKSGGGIGIGEW